MDAIAEMERALGPEAVRTLAQRRLLCSGAVTANECADEPTRLDRTTGVVLVTSFIFAVYLWGVDVVIVRVYEWLFQMTARLFS